MGLMGRDGGLERSRRELSRGQICSVSIGVLVTQV